jgi:signal transduction histidine kinase
LTGESAQGSRRPSCGAGERQERFAALISAERSAILASYAESLEAMHSPVVAEPRARDQAMTNGAEIIAEVVASVQGGDARTGGRYPMPAWMIGQEKAGSQPRPPDMLRAAAAFFDVTVEFLARCVEDHPELLPCFIMAVLALNEGISRRIRETTLAYNGYLLELLDQAHIDERRRIARDLHDRLGEGMSAALRQLELHEITSGKHPLVPEPRVAIAKEALTEAMRRLRVVTSDLRQDPLRSLETALVQYIDSASADAEVRLRVSGDEKWAPPGIIEETYLIIREAIRNALRHGSPRMVLIGVAVAPHELHAWVEDDGRGFKLAGSAEPVFTGIGLTAMRERAALMGGRLTLASVPGQGTQVELLVPLPGHRDA